jgi:hypothetical protein
MELPMSREYNRSINIKTTPEFDAAVESVARRSYMTKSQYVRNATLVALARDGIVPVPASDDEPPRAA